MGSMSAKNEERAREAAEHVRKLLEDAGYSEIEAGILDLGGRIVILWTVKVAADG